MARLLNRLDMLAETAPLNRSDAQEHLTRWGFREPCAEREITDSDS
jgi:hypothetical protein